MDSTVPWTLEERQGKYQLTVGGLVLQISAQDSQLSPVFVLRKRSPPLSHEGFVGMYIIASLDNSFKHPFIKVKFSST